MSKKYNEIMDQIRVTDKMKQRVLQNVKEGIEAEKTPESGKIIRSRFLSYGRAFRYLSVAACIMMLLVGGLTVPKILNRGNAPQNEAGGEVGAMIGNGMVEVNSLAELSQALGFSVPEVKHIPFEVTGIVYTNGWNEFAQVEYQGGAMPENQEESQMEDQTESEAVLFRKARGTDDISGDYNVYTDVKEITVNEAAVTLKGETGQYRLAVWQQDGFTYSLSWEPGGSEEVFTEMIQSIP